MRRIFGTTSAHAAHQISAVPEPAAAGTTGGRWSRVQSLAKLVFALFLIGGVITGVGSLASAATKSCSGGSPGENAVCRAEKQVGDPYAWGAEGPNRFDCSGLVYYAYKGSGLGLARTTAEGQSHKGKAVSTKNLKKGDLLFFNWDGGEIDHVGIYAGNGKMVHASSSSGKVKKVTLNSYYKDHLETATRIAPASKPPKTTPKKPSTESETTTTPKEVTPSPVETLIETDTILG